MELKHQWNEQQQQIIIAAKKQLERKLFEINLDIVVAVQIALERKNIPFYKGWDDITEDLAGSGSFSDPIRTIPERLRLSGRTPGSHRLVRGR